MKHTLWIILLFALCMLLPGLAAAEEAVPAFTIVDQDGNIIQDGDTVDPGDQLRAISDDYNMFFDWNFMDLCGIAGTRDITVYNWLAGDQSLTITVFPSYDAYDRWEPCASLKLYVSEDLNEDEPLTVSIYSESGTFSDGSYVKANTSLSADAEELPNFGYFEWVVNGEQLSDSAWFDVPEDLVGETLWLYVYSSHADLRSGDRSLAKTSLTLFVVADEPRVTAVEITAPVRSGKPGETVQLGVHIEAEEGADTTVEWFSDFPSFIDVDNQGLVTFLRPGCINIFCMAGDEIDAILLECIGPDVMTLPADLKVLESEALRGCSAQAIILPDGLTTIGDHVFTNCSNLNKLVIPASVTSIGDNELYHENTVIFCETEDCLAYEWAFDHGFLAYVTGE